MRSWKISGVYATWVMTVELLPPDLDEDDPPPEPCPEPNFDALAGHFRTLVEMAEALKRLELT
ncbi:hypothetical protein [Saccharothrix coeruleofusca]|uniref:Uncharacterized protein n=1 Tax=Saccharothrix coeruleofusca TaxID=33919 RepID=A0A918AQS6_9PSEU|nr:hypothetical protein [Saccharothrix coeruleofusca]MBP2339194.1 hypothetical protein [Saccharothrix coeruleofusca]GGP70596.1 hypothetical protein GCM10010185_49610 [Saccharothrix coeruleofusca]